MREEEAAPVPGKAAEPDINESAAWTATFRSDVACA